MRVAIIGGGITGMFISYYLRKDGHDVTLVEKNPSGFVTSIYNAGLITPSFSPAPPVGLVKVASTILGARGPLYISATEVVRNPRWFLRAMREGVSVHESEVVELGSKSLELYRAFFREENVEADLQPGILGLYRDREHAKAMAEKLGERFVDENEVAEMGFLGLGGGVLAEREISVNPVKLCNELRSRLSEMGVNIRAGKQATVSAEKGIAVTTLEGGERLVADVHVVASGAMSREVLIPLGYRPLVLPARGLVMLYDTGGKKLVQHPALLEDYGIALVQHNASTVRLTSFFEMVGYKKEFTERRKRWLEDTTRRHLPAFGELKFVQEGTGYRPCTPDQIPVIGRVPQYANLYVATGNCRLGITLAPVSAQIIRSMINGTEPSGVAWRLLDPERFS